MSSFEIKGSDGRLYYCKRLEKSLAEKHRNEIAVLLSQIDGADFNYSLITKEEYKSRRLHEKWKLSFLCFDDRSNVCAVLLAYYRLDEPGDIFDSIYIHRLVVDERHRKLGVGTKLLSKACNYYFENLSWLNNVTIQATVLPRNIKACKLYKKIGFKAVDTIHYKNKKDRLYLKERGSLNYKDKGVDLFHNYRFVVSNDRRGKFYFSTSSDLKLSQFKSLFSSLNIELSVHKTALDLVEPQVDNATEESEQILVSHPLKNSSRFLVKEGRLPFFVEDTMLFIERFNKDFENEPELPGLDTKRWWRQLGNSGILELMGETSRRRAKYVSQIGCMFDKKKYVFGRGEIEGYISFSEDHTEIGKKLFPLTNPFFFHKIFIPLGYDRALSSLTPIEFGKVDYRRRALIDLLSQIDFPIVDVDPQDDLGL